MKKTYRHWVNGYGYYVFKTWKVYWAYRCYMTEQMNSGGVSPMIGFELYLIEQGFKCYHFKVDSGKLIKVDGFCPISTMVNIHNRYLKGNLDIKVGLSEKGRPTTIVYPRPKGIYNDDQMNQFILSNSNENILEAIYENTI